jgi:chromosome segregation ATPase
MDKGRIKNAVLVLLLTVTIFSVYRYLAELKQKYELSVDLAKAKEAGLALEKEKQNLLVAIDKEKSVSAGLSQKIFVLKNNFRAAKVRLNKLFTDYQRAQSELDDLDAKFSLLKAEKVELEKQNKLITEENSGLKEKLGSVAELKKAMHQLRKQAQKVTVQIRKKFDQNRVIEGNNGFLMKNGLPTYPAKVKIEVVPAPEGAK